MINKKTVAKVVLALVFVVSAGLKGVPVPPPSRECPTSPLQDRICHILKAKTKLSLEKINEIVSNIPDSFGIRSSENNGNSGAVGSATRSAGSARR